MPELPEVQTVVEHIRPDLLGEQIIGIEPIWPKVLHNFIPEDLINETIDTHIENVKRRAKFIIIQLPDHIIAVHLRMTGKLYFVKKNELFFSRIDFWHLERPETNATHRKVAPEATQKF